MALTKLIDWMRLFTSPEGSFKDGSITVYVYGEDDQSYVVIEEEISASPRVVNQYTLHPLLEDNGLFSLVSFLRSCEFDLNTICSTIRSADYIEDGMNDICRLDHIEIARYQLQEN